MKKILGIFAHPDDESFGPAGTLAYYASMGHRVGLVTMTRGEAGSLGISKELEPAELARRRSEELSCAATVLGIQYLQLFDLPDKKLSNVPDETGREMILAEINQFRPDLIITFHQNGISGHPDHKTVTRWVMDSVNQLKYCPALFFYGIPVEYAEMIPNRQMYPLQPREITHRIDVSSVFQQRRKALECHKTQEELWKIFQSLPVDFETFSQWEYFSQVRPLPVSRDISYQLLEETETVIS